MTPKLQEVLLDILTGLNNPDNYYLVKANYYDWEGWKIQQAGVYLNQDVSIDVALEKDVISCLLYLTPDNPGKLDQISIPLKQIWGIWHNDSPFFNPGIRLYYNPKVLEKQKHLD